MFSAKLQQLIDEETHELKLSFQKTNDELKRTIAEKDKEIENLRLWIKKNLPNTLLNPK